MSRRSGCCGAARLAGSADQDSTVQKDTMAENRHNTISNEPWPAPESSRLTGEEGVYGP